MDSWSDLLSSYAFIQFLPAILVLGQLLVSSSRALRKISFASYGLSFHSRYAANVNFMTDPVGLIGNGYNKVSLQNTNYNTIARPFR